MEQAQQRTVNIDSVLLGKPFEEQSPESFHEYICSLKDSKSISKEKKEPKLRVKKEVVQHDVTEQSPICQRCLKKPRNPKAKCSGIVAQKVTHEENNLDLVVSQS